MWLTPSFPATSHTSTGCPLKVKALLRAVTDNADILDKSVVISSLIPSLKYSCSASPLMLAKGSTHMDSLGGRSDLPAAGPGSAPVAPTRAVTLPSTLRQPGAWTSPSQSRRSAQWIWLNGIGGTVPSTLTWTSVPFSRAASASARTHCDLAASADQITTTAPAALSRSSITSPYARWAGSSSSRHTSWPRTRNASATCRACASVDRAYETKTCDILGSVPR